MYVLLSQVMYCSIKLHSLSLLNSVWGKLVFRELFYTEFPHIFPLFSTNPIKYWILLRITTSLCLFYLKTNPSIKWTISVFSSIVKLKQNKALLILKEGCTVTFFTVLWDMKGWKAKLSSSNCPFLFIKNLTFPSTISFFIWLTSKSKP